MTLFFCKFPDFRTLSQLLAHFCSTFSAFFTFYLPVSTKDLQSQSDATEKNAVKVFLSLFLTVSEKAKGDFLCSLEILLFFKVL
jgi:hypothetical protein